MKDLISINDMTEKHIMSILKHTKSLKRQLKEGLQHQFLKGKTLGMIFTKSSTRTRVSFEVGMYQLGGQAIFLSSNDIQLGRGESIEDTAKVLSRYLDGIMIRTFDHQDVIDLAKYATIPVINGLTDLLHPCQILADLFTIYEVKENLKELKLAYIGDGNNVANSLLLGCSKTGVDITVATPKGFECEKEIIDKADENSKISGSKVVITHDPIEAATDADIIYTDTWVSMGMEDEKENRIKTFMKYQVNKEMMNLAKKDSMFLHCLPAYRGYEVTDEIIDGENSYVIEEAENRLHVQKSVMVDLMGDING
jgi:ornithine carbamoyltransferase